MPISKKVFLDAFTRNVKAEYTPMGMFSSTVTFEMMDKANAYWPDAHHDPVKMARLGAMPYEMFGIESMKIPFDVTVEAGALGADVDYGTKQIVPQVKHGFSSPDELVMPDDLSTAGRVPVVLEALRILTKQYPDILVCSHVMGPVSLCSMLFGFDKLLEWMIDEDAAFDLAMDFATNISIAYGKLSVEAGNQVIAIGEAAATATILGPRIYEKNIIPYHNRYKEHFPKIPVMMHICGDISPYLPILPKCTYDAISFDQMTGMKKTDEMLQESGMKKVGNVAPLDVILNGTPEDVRREVIQCLDDHVDVLAAGCALSPNTPAKNIEAFVSAYKEYMKDRKGLVL